MKHPCLKAYWIELVGQTSAASKTAWIVSARRSAEPAPRSFPSVASSTAPPWMWNQICRSCSSTSASAAGSPVRASLGFGCCPWNFSEPFRNAPRRSQCSGYSGFGTRARYTRATRACALAGMRWANTSCDLPTARFGVSEYLRRAKNLVAHANRIASRVEALRSVGPPAGQEQRIERSNDRLVVGRWLIARYARRWGVLKEGLLETTQPCACGKPGKRCCAHSHDPGMR